MKVNELTGLGFKAFNMADGNREISGGYCGDLLSWVMGRASENCAWVTIMSNRNLVAVAEMADVACIILSEGVEPDPDMLSKAVEEGINVLGSEMNSFDLCAKLYPLVNG